MAELSTEWTLTVDAASPSSLVSASYLLLFHLEATEPGTIDSSGERDLGITVTLRDVYKGSVNDEINTTASFTIRQTGLDQVGEGPPPPIDPDFLRPGISYLLDAGAASDGSLAAIFNAARGVYPEAFSLDAQLGQTAEAKFATGDYEETVEWLFSVIEDRNDRLHDPAGEYLWLRLESLRTSERDDTLERVVALALDPQTQPRLAITLLAELDLVSLDLLEEDPKALRKLTGAYLAGVTKQLSSPVADYVVNENLYNAVFADDETPSSSIADYDIPLATLEQASAVLRGIENERAKALFGWMQ